VINRPSSAGSASPAPSAPPLPLALASSSGGGGSPLPKVLIAAFIVIVAIGAYLYFGAIPPVATGEIMHLTACPIHSVSNTALAANPSAAKVENTFDEVIVVAEVRLRNQSRGPIFLSDMAGLLTLPAEEHRSLAANATDFNRVFVAYPQLLPMKQQPLLRDITIAPGETVEGQLIFNYPVTKDQWDARRSYDVTLSFLHQRDLVLPAPQ
jgi:hypothetical protein